ncbi:patatin-like phospholipase family protein [Clostridium sp. BNL1100]|uniref:patatin-like phospholipase family protein n=1 Tax=Clostridium sp. BNL1100 TaxID=755731 RepID=UPI001FA72BFE|nr:patatin-like phospholipase family protein [Clostridium sp. BNL1100]
MKEDIEYLALEGGGGCGNAFIGAIKALEDINVIQHENFRIKNIKGVAGASAGSITSLFLACGYNSREITDILKLENFNKFFDGPDINKQPFLINNNKMSNTRFLEREQKRLNGLSDIHKKILQGLGIKFKTLRDFKLGEFQGIIGKYLNPIIDDVITNFGKNNLPDEVLLRIKKGKRDLVYCLHTDFGVFTGNEIRNFFDKWISMARVRIENPDMFKNASISDLSRTYDQSKSSYEFKKLYMNTSIGDLGKLTKTKLAFTGTNMLDMKSYIFSSFDDMTNKISAADIVRISMSIPFAYKPIIIEPEDLQYIFGSSDWKNHRELEGVWVDGGLTNNIPINAFKQFSNSSSQPNTFGLRLNKDEQTPIFNILDFIKQYLSLLGGTGEAHMSGTQPFNDNCIQLDASPLKLFSFTPDPKDFDKVNAKSYVDVVKYFECQNVCNPVCEFLLSQESGRSNGTVGNRLR